MAIKYVDQEGLGVYTQQLAAKLGDVFVKKEEGKTLSSNDYTAEDKQKLEGLEPMTNEEIDANFAQA